MSSPILSILIVNWNSGNHLNLCLESIYQNPPEVEFEVIVVDNASEDESSDCAATSNGVRLIRNDYNFGFSYANNQAFSISSGELVMPLNPDTRIPPGLFSRLTDEMNDCLDVGLIAPLLETGGNIINPGYNFRLFYDSHLRSLFRTREPDRKTASVNGDRPSLTDFKFVRGTGYICRRKAVESNYLFAPRTFLFGEEFHLCRTIAKAGFRVVVSNDTCIKHAKSVTFKSFPARKLVARRLLQAALWDERRTYFGVVPGFVSHVTRVIDLLIIAMLCWLRAIASDSDARAKYSELARSYKLDAWLLIRLLTYRQAEFIKINRDAARFFNSGKEVRQELIELWSGRSGPVV